MLPSNGASGQHTQSEPCQRDLIGCEPKREQSCCNSLNGRLDELGDLTVKHLRIVPG